MGKITWELQNDLGNHNLVLFMHHPEYSMPKVLTFAYNEGSASKVRCRDALEMAKAYMKGVEDVFDSILQTPDAYERMPIEERQHWFREAVFRDNEYEANWREGKVAIRVRNQGGQLS